MESGNDLLDNRYFLIFEQAFPLVEKIVSEEFPGFVISNFIDKGAYFEINIVGPDIEINLSSYRAYLEFSFKRFNVQIDLSNYDDLMKGIELASSKNIIYLIEIIKKYLKEN